jgi:hypothetical protein
VIAPRPANSRFHLLLISRVSGAIAPARSLVVADWRASMAAVASAWLRNSVSRSSRACWRECCVLDRRGGGHRRVSGTRQFWVPRGIAAMWLTISGVAAVTGALLYVLWRHRDRVGFIADWTIILVGSAVAAPMIGEIGTPAGSVSAGAGSGSAGAIIACSLLGPVIIVAGAALARLHARR